MNVPEFKFSTKAGTLYSLSAHLTKAHLPDQIIVHYGKWQSDAEAVLTRIVSEFSEQRLAVRSSAANEDTQSASMAGAHLSLINVDCEKAALQQAIEDVFQSYEAAGSVDEVLIQPMVEDTVVAGVVMTRDLDTGAPYYVINYDDFSGRTDTVTGGGESKVVLVHRAYIGALRSPRFRELIQVVQEIERTAGTDELDIEFCIDGEDRIYILQVRPLAARSQWSENIDNAIDNALDVIRAQIAEPQSTSNTVGTAASVYGEMPDWNPAEMIGSVPRPLALSLYRELITDRIWSRARVEMGYRAVPHPLMRIFAGRPYVDTRLSFNSFLPAELDDELAARIVDCQLDRLSTRRDLHDKIEFEIAITARDLSGPLQFASLSTAGFTSGEILRLSRALKTLTQRLLDDDLSAQIALTEGLAADSNSWHLAGDRIDPGLSTDIQDRGTLPFSKLARHGFVAVLMLRSLVSAGVFTKDEAERFMQGIPTVASDLMTDLRRAAQGELSQKSLANRYGHLRPGAYDIRSDRYDSRPDLYLNWHSISGAGKKFGETFQPSAGQMSRIDELLKKSEYVYDAERLLKYITQSVQARELAKFNFMRGVSQLLEMIAEWGAEHEFDRDDLSYLPIDLILAGKGQVDLRTAIESGRERHNISRALRLPHIITDISDIDIVRMPLGQPNYITSLSVAAPPQLLTNQAVADIAGKIVLIESADPGFDWIFAHGIAGLITKYGGVNSHMAIRSAEFGLPAAIGCGTRLFDALTNASAIELDCAARTVRPIGEKVPR